MSSGARTEPGLVVYRFGVGLFYANAHRLSDDVLALVDVPEPPRWFVLLADAMDDVDFTGGKTLLELAGQLADRNVVLCIAAADECCPNSSGSGSSTPSAPNTSSGLARRLRSPHSTRRGATGDG